MKNVALIKYNTKKCVKVKLDSRGNFLRCDLLDDVPGKKIDQYRKLLKKQKIRFVEKISEDGQGIQFNF